MSEHTPAPWNVTRYNDLQYSISNSGEGYEERYVEDNEDSANARLISAAPELLNALKGLINVCTHPKSTKADMKRIAKEALAIIRKAEGE